MNEYSEKEKLLTINQIRDLITDYINSNDLNHGSQKNHVYLDPLLSKLVVEK